MTTKDYILLAKVLNKVWKSYEDDFYPEQEAINRVEYELTQALKEDNSKFDEDKWLKAVYGKE